MNINVCQINEENLSTCRYFYRMLDPFSKQYALSYIKEEQLMLKDFLSNYPFVKNMNFVAVGAGELCHLRIALEYTKRYIAVEPLARFFINDSINFLLEREPRVCVIDKIFEQISREDIGYAPVVFVFLFNVSAYIDNLIMKINEIIKPQDVIFISQWNCSSESAIKTHREYFQYVNKHVKDDFKFSKECINDDSLFEKINYFSKMECKEGNIIKAKVIYT